MINSRLSGLRDVDPAGRRKLVAQGAGIDEAKLAALDPAAGLTVAQADHLIDCRRPARDRPPARGRPRRDGRERGQHDGRGARPRIAELAGGRTLLRILSNKADLRLTRARAVFDAELLGGAPVVDDIVLAAAFAEADPYRAATHNKGIMNGITAVVLATGNDTRAVESGCHSHAVRDGRYRALSHFEKDADGNLVGTLEVPLAVGLVGGATRSHPVARSAVDLLGVRTAAELAGIVASVGLAQNLAALRALAAEGIRRGHMTLHARTVAVAAGPYRPGSSRPHRSSPRGSFA